VEGKSSLEAIYRRGWLRFRPDHDDDDGGAAGALPLALERGWGPEFPPAPSASDRRGLIVSQASRSTRPGDLTSISTGAALVPALRVGGRPRSASGAAPDHREAVMRWAICDPPAPPSPSPPRCCTRDRLRGPARTTWRRRSSPPTTTRKLPAGRWPGRRTPRPAARGGKSSAIPAERRSRLKSSVSNQTSPWRGPVPAGRAALCARGAGRLFPTATLGSA